MYNPHYGLKETPFSIAPNPKYLFMGAQHQEALAHLLYSLETTGGFVLLTGEVGTGKTTITRCFLDKLPDTADVAYVLHPKMSATELLASICDELEIRYLQTRFTTKNYIDVIRRRLLDTHAQGRRTFVIIDEAQNLTEDVLEQVRLLTNLETAETKLLQMILIGQPELRELFEKPSLRQLNQRITARFHLSHLDRQEVPHYIRHRLQVAGAKGNPFTDSAMEKVYRFTGGIPRLINVLCDRALLGGYVSDTKIITPQVVVSAATQVFGQSAKHVNFKHIGKRLQKFKLFSAKNATLVMIGLLGVLVLNTQVGYTPLSQFKHWLGLEDIRLSNTALGIHWSDIGPSDELAAELVERAPIQTPTTIHTTIQTPITPTTLIQTPTTTIQAPIKSSDHIDLLSVPVDDVPTVVNETNLLAQIRTEIEQIESPEHINPVRINMGEPQQSEVLASEEPVEQVLAKANLTKAKPSAELDVPQAAKKKKKEKTEERTNATITKPTKTAKPVELAKKPLKASTATAPKSARKPVEAVSSEPRSSHTATETDSTATHDLTPTEPKLNSSQALLAAHQAFDLLLNYWNAEPLASDTESEQSEVLPQDLDQLCARAGARDLSCLSRTGNLQALALLDRPALLTLNSVAPDNGQAAQSKYVTLVGIGARHVALAGLQVDAKPLVWERAFLESKWGGKYHLLWRPPPHGSGTYQPGSQGDAVSWLDQKLKLLKDKRALYYIIGDYRGVYDNTMMNAVRSFQRAQGVEADGLVTQTTLVLMDNVLDPSVPRLRAVDVSQLEALPDTAVEIDSVL